LKDPEIVDIEHTSPVETVSHGIYPVQDDRKHSLLLAMLEGPASGRVLVFTRTKHRARKLARDLDKSGYRVSSLRGDMTQSARQTAMRGFRDGRYDILVATDVAARGIDVSDISHVINFDMPDTADAYTHRIGRTGRANTKGEAFTLAVQADDTIVRDVEKILGFRIERRRLSEFDYGDLVPENMFPERRNTRPAGNRPAGGPARGPAGGRSSTSGPGRGGFRGGFGRRQAS
jgi:ATP-dependent RNA helicase RhlE